LLGGDAFTPGRSSGLLGIRTALPEMIGALFAQSNLVDCEFIKVRTKVPSSHPRVNLCRQLWLVPTVLAGDALVEPLLEMRMCAYVHVTFAHDRRQFLMLLYA
jgi:hypothetical protein